MSADPIDVSSILTDQGGNLTIVWLDGGDEAEYSPNPAYPNGVDLVDNLEARSHCITRLPYPAPRCGSWSVTCRKCRKSVYVTTAGRADDPCSLSVACALSVLAQEANNDR